VRESALYQVLAGILALAVVVGGLVLLLLPRAEARELVVVATSAPVPRAFPVGKVFASEATPTAPAMGSAEGCGSGIDEAEDFAARCYASVRAGLPDSIVRFEPTWQTSAIDVRHDAADPTRCHQIWRSIAYVRQSGGESEARRFTCDSRREEWTLAIVGPAIDVE